MAFRWYNPATWRMFGYTDPQTGDYVEVDLEVGAKRTKAGVRVTYTTAIAIPIVWTCVRLLSESGGGLPLKAYEEDGLSQKPIKLRGREGRLLRKPNPYTTMHNHLKAIIANMALRGNAYALIERNDEGERIGEVLLNPEWVEPDRDAAGQPFYWVIYEGRRTPVSPENMLHFKLFSLDGFTGLSPLEHMAETMGMAAAAQGWAARFMRKGGVSGGYVIYDKFLTKEQQTQIMAKFPDIRKDDVDSLGSWGILQGGPKVVPAGLSQKDAQFLETTQLQEEALAGVWGVPLFLAMRAGRTSIMGSNLEQQLTSFVMFGLSPYIKAIEDEYNDKVYGNGRFVEFVIEGLLRGDSAGRAAYYQIALGGNNGPGWMSQDDVRDKEGMPRLGGKYSELIRWERAGNADQT